MQGILVPQSPIAVWDCNLCYDCSAPLLPCIYSCSAYMWLWLGTLGTLIVCSFLRITQVGSSLIHSDSG